MDYRIELFILNQAGEIIFFFSNQGESSKREEQTRFLTASYLTSILKFAKATSGNIISTFEMGKININLRLGISLSLIFVMLLDKRIRVSEKQIDKILGDLITEFEKSYNQEQLAKWNGNLEAFDDFIPLAKRILKKIG